MKAAAARAVTKVLRCRKGKRQANNAQSTCKGWSARNLRCAVEPSGSRMRTAAVLGVPARGSAWRPAFLLAFRLSSAAARSAFLCSTASFAALHATGTTSSPQLCMSQKVATTALSLRRPNLSVGLLSLKQQQHGCLPGGSRARSCRFGEGGLTANMEECTANTVPAQQTQESSQAG